MVSENVLTPRGLVTKGAILNINRGRKRESYIAPDGTRTSMLPADPYSVAYYLAKGFHLPTEEQRVSEPKDAKGILSCPLCQKDCQGAFGLQAHLRTHIGKSKKEV